MSANHETSNVRTATTMIFVILAGEKQITALSSPSPRDGRPCQTPPPGAAVALFLLRPLWAGSELPKGPPAAKIHGLTLYHYPSTNE
jgi:hypothetical protein